MDMKMEAAHAVLLVGGKGTRLKSVMPFVPKPLAPVGSHLFLELLVRHLRYQEIRHLVMCTGYLADQIEKAFGDGHPWNVAIEYSHETHELGTAGAVKHAQHFLKGAEDFLVINGDSFLEIDYGRLFEFHRQQRGLVSMAVLRVEDASRYGTVQIGAKGRVTGFSEKAAQHGPGIVNGGVYVFSRSVFDHIPAGRASLERDVFPRLLEQGIYALEQTGMFIDIGTPEDYAKAQRMSGLLADAAFQQRGNTDCWQKEH